MSDDVELGRPTVPDGAEPPGVALRPRVERTRLLAAVAGLVGAVLFVLYFGVPALVPKLAAVLYGSDPPTTQVVAAGAGSAQLLTFGVWLQATGSALCVVFFLALVGFSGRRGTLLGQIVALGSAGLVALVLLEGVFTLTWSTASAAGTTASARTAFDLMSRFIQVFPLVPAPAVYLPLGAILLTTSLLPRWLSMVAFGLGVAFFVAGLTGILLPAAQAATAGLAGAQALWIIAAAGTLARRRAPGAFRAPASA